MWDMNFIVEHNLPFAAADHLAKLIKVFFPDSKVAKSYTNVTMKAAYILNRDICRQIVQFNMQVVFVFPTVYEFATLESGKETFINFAKWSASANGRLCSAMKPENLTSANRASFSESESFLE